MDGEVRDAPGPRFIPLYEGEPDGIMFAINHVRQHRADANLHKATFGAAEASVFFHDVYVSLSVKTTTELPRGWLSLSPRRFRVVCMDVEWRAGVLEQVTRQIATPERTYTQLQICRLAADAYSVVHAGYAAATCARADLETMLGVKMSAPWPHLPNPDARVPPALAWDDIARPIQQLRAALVGCPSPSDVDPASGWRVTRADDETFECVRDAATRDIVIVVAGGMPEGVALVSVYVRASGAAVRVGRSFADHVAGRWVVNANRGRVVQRTNPFADVDGHDVRWVVPPMSPAPAPASRALVPFAPRGAANGDVDIDYARVFHHLAYGCPSRRPAVQKRAASAMAPTHVQNSAAIAPVAHSVIPTRATATMPNAPAPHDGVALRRHENPLAGGSIQPSSPLPHTSSRCAASAATAYDTVAAAVDPTIGRNDTPSTARIQYGTRSCAICRSRSRAAAHVLRRLFQMFVHDSRPPVCFGMMPSLV